MQITVSLNWGQLHRKVTDEPQSLVRNNSVAFRWGGLIYNQKEVDVRITGAGGVGFGQ